MTALKKNTQTLQREIAWLTQVIDTRLKLYFNNECAFTDIHEVPVPSLEKDTSAYAGFVSEKQLSVDERLALVLAIVPFLKPELLDAFYTRNASYDKGFSEFGGIRGKTHGGFIPSGETLLFILAGNNLEERLEQEQFFLYESVLLSENILKLQAVEGGEPPMSGALTLGAEYYAYFTKGEIDKPQYSSDFPAKLMKTAYTWSDLVLDAHIMKEVEEIRTWVEHNPSIRSHASLSKMLKPGYKSLFYGPPGTGKTLTASLLGKITGKDVYRIDLSMVVSKFIGETEKNLGKVFDMAEHRNWILFFDEADALFGKRTSTSSSNDRYANQEVAYLLQRVEDYDGLIILASNLKSNIDEAFARRFQSMIHFPLPGEEERLKLWQNAFNGSVELADDVDFKALAHKHAMAGGSIVNVLLYCVLVQRQSGQPVTQHAITEGIKRELRKEGKTP
jgi:hypothetical protein